VGEPAIEGPVPVACVALADANVIQGKFLTRRNNVSTKRRAGRRLNQVAARSSMNVVSPLKLSRELDKLPSGEEVLAAAALPNSGSLKHLGALRGVELHKTDTCKWLAGQQEIPQ
jgi:hypothetical protein